MNNLALTSYNKRFLYAAIGAPGSTHDARMLKQPSYFDKVLSGRALPDRETNLGGFGDIPLVTIEDSAFPRFSWLTSAAMKIREINSNVTSTRCSVAQELFRKIHTEC